MGEESLMSSSSNDEMINLDMIKINETHLFSSLFHYLKAKMKVCFWLNLMLYNFSVLNVNLSPSTDSFGEQVHLFWIPLSEPWGKQEMEEPLLFCARLLQHQLLRQQISKTNSCTDGWSWYYSLMCFCFSTQSFEKCLHPKGTINCAGYKVLTSIEEYLDLISNSLPGK